MSRAPLVTVVVPNYNHARHLPQRLDSILNQSFKDFELLLLDDCSTDDSRRVLSEYAARCGARCDFNSVNSGSPFKQWNRGARQARGEYVWIAESDDSASPEFLATLVGLLESDPSLVLAYCRVESIDEEGRPSPGGPIGLYSTPRWLADYTADGPEECARYMCFQATIPNASAVVFRRSAMAAAGWAEEGMRYCGDWITWARLLAHGRLAFTARVLSQFRIHSASLGNRSAGRGVYYRESARVVAEILQRFPASPDIHRAAVQGRLGEWVGYCLDRPRRFLDADGREVRKALAAVEPSLNQRMVKAMVHQTIQRLKHSLR